MKTLVKNGMVEELKYTRHFHLGRLLGGRRILGSETEFKRNNVTLDALMECNKLHTFPQLNIIIISSPNYLKPIIVCIVYTHYPQSLHENYLYIIMSHQYYYNFHLMYLISLSSKSAGW